ncbi:hypothetical protein C1Y41_04395 [Pantoea sp. ICBG 1758]|nr:hypothetical protein C1Y41_04395 [Pantoea sp. ICBG 1758]
MKRSWFQHYPMSDNEASNLIAYYQKRGVQTQKSLTADPRFFVVSAFLPMSNYIPPSQRSFINRLWQ